MPNDSVNNPLHYTSHPSGVECTQITEWMNFCLGNAVKYIWRAHHKNKTPIEDLKKARWYLDREISRLEGDKSAAMVRLEKELAAGDWVPEPPAQKP